MIVIIFTSNTTVIIQSLFLHSSLTACNLWRCTFRYHSDNSVIVGTKQSDYVQALEVYPESARLLGMLAECEQRGHTLSRLRLHLTTLCQATPAALLWLMAIKAEATLPAASHRVQVISHLLSCLCCCVMLDCAALLYPVVLLNIVL